MLKRDHIQDFFVKKGYDIPEFSDKYWVADFEFVVDVTALINELNVKLQCKGLFVNEMYSTVKAFMRKLHLFSSQVRDNILTYLPTLKEGTRSADQVQNHFRSTAWSFQGDFKITKLLELHEMHMVSSPFSRSVDNAPSFVQTRPNDMKSDTLLAEHIRSVSLLDFYSSSKRRTLHN